MWSRLRLWRASGSGAASGHHGFLTAVAASFAADAAFCALAAELVAAAAALFAVPAALFAAFAAFFAATFCAIVWLLIDKVATGRMPDFTLTYKWAGIPVGSVVLVLTLAYLGTLWVKRQLRRE